MRKLTFLLLLIPFLGYAQLDSTQWMGGGSATGNVTNIADTYAYNFSLEPQAGFFLSPSHIVGLQGAVGFASQGNSYSGVGFYRYLYFLNPSMALMGQAELGYLYRETVSVFDGSKTTFQGLRFGAKGGISSFLSPNISLDTFLYYDANNSYGISPKSGESAPTLEQNFGLGVGFQIYF